jgi:hypothetical protein
MNKVIRVGTVRLYANGPAVSLFCRIEFADGRLSITGVEGPTRNGNARGGCGQIVMNPWSIVTYAPGWDAALVERFRAVWQEWHLNDMQAGSPAQTAFLKANPVTAVYPECHYTKASAALESAGLNPDPDYVHERKPYRYGSAWLRVDVPAEVIEFLQSLPDADRAPAWV